MNKGTVTFFIFFLLIAGGLLSFVVLGDNEDNPLVGTWVMKSGVYLGPDGKPDVGAAHQMKVINDTHFTTIWEDTIDRLDRGYNGGSYTYNNGIYTEYLEYFTIEDRVGDTAHFKVDVNGNEISISECDASGNISKTGYFQIWERVD